MEKLKMHSPNLTQDNIARIRDLFPGCVTEAKGEDGSVRLAVDFDQLRQELAESIVEGPQERYHLNWPGKREALLAANAPIAKTLRPCREESVNFDTTKNLLIEGDNLDALKLMQETYLGRVKLIYIDPPYNTGKDFIYYDNFSNDAESYLRQSNQTSSDGGRLVANPESNGRFHSSWLSMMSARLKLARNLLRNDGVIFISIDDNEDANLGRMCDEIFGHDNFIAKVVWEKMYTTKNDSALISRSHEYLLVYARDINSDPIHLLPRTAEMDARYTNSDDDPRGPWKAIPLYAKGERKNGRYPVVSPSTGKVHYPATDSHWLYAEKDTNEMIRDNRIYFGKDGNAQPNVKRFLTEVQQGAKAKTLWKHNEVGSNDSAKRELKELYGDDNVPFDFPKPVALISRILALSTTPNQENIVLDFFAGSGTTGHAVMLRQLEDVPCRFILVQINQEIDKENKEQVVAAEYCEKLGRPKNIAEITKDRLRRVGKTIGEGKKVDVGFRVLRIDTSNMSDVYYAPDALNKAEFDLFVDNIKPDRTPEDLLFQVMLDWGVDLALPITKQSIQGKDVFFVDGNVLAACFDASGSIDEAFVKELAKQQPLRVVFRDAGYKNSAVKINVEQIFKLLSPATEVKCI